MKPKMDQVEQVPLEANPPQARLGRGTPFRCDLADHSHGMSRTPAPRNRGRSVLFPGNWRRPPAAGTPRRGGLARRTCSTATLGTAQGSADHSRHCTPDEGTRLGSAFVTGSTGILASGNAPRCGLP